jgi:Glutathione S-transferase, N-terminal domain
MPEDEAAGRPIAPPVLYGRYASPFVRRVAVTLRLYGVVYRHVPLMPFGRTRQNWPNSIRSPGCRRCGWITAKC